MRPTREDVLMEIAKAVATRGTCDRKMVGAVIARQGRPLSVGYNGAPPGLPHCDENDHGWSKAFREGFSVTEALEMHGCHNATHAEANALAFAAKYGISTDGARLFVTVAPCENCARLLIAAGIIEVCYLEAYRDGSGIELLTNAGLTISTFSD